MFLALTQFGVVYFSKWKSDKEAHPTRRGGRWLAAAVEDSHPPRYRCALIGCLCRHVADSSRPRGEDTEWVTVTYSKPRSSKDDWIGVFSPANFSDSICPPENEWVEPPLLCTTSIKVGLFPLDFSI